MKEYEYINHPSHYNKPGKKECIVIMEELFGPLWVGIFCILSAFKYKYRCGDKPNEDIAREKDKIYWYLTYARKISQKIKKAENKLAVETAIKVVEKYEN